VTFADANTTPIVERLPVLVQWGSVIAGAIGAAALALVLHGFAAAIVGELDGSDLA
jgi:hypothetical protein